MELFNLSQPAVSQAIAKLERDAGADLVQRMPQGIFATAIGATLLNRVKRALHLLDRAMSRCNGRLKLTATASQLRALIAVREAENFTLAARQIGIAQPTVHRTITQLEQDSGQALFAPVGEAAPKRIIESGSLVLMRQLLQASDHLGCISALQVAAEIEHGLLRALPLDMKSTKRPIGITTRSGWMPTPSHATLLGQLSSPAEPL